jgi:hypothetical protein
MTDKQGEDDTNEAWMVSDRVGIVRYCRTRGGLCSVCSGVFGFGIGTVSSVVLF